MIPDPSAATLIERLRQRSPGALELATYASLAVYIEPELLRALRLGVAPHLEVGAEADLWSSRIVQAASHQGMTLRPAVAHLLREALRDEVEREVARLAWSIVQQVHADTSPAIAQEEALAWYAIEGSGTDIERALKRALRSMAEERERGLARWWMRARERLPTEVRSSRTAHSLDRRAMLELGMESASEEIGEDAFQRMLDDAGERLVYARRGHSALEIGDFEPDAATVSLRVPDLSPVRLDVIWEPEGEPVTVTLRPGYSEIVTVSGKVTEVVTERGDVYAVEHAPRGASEAELLLLGMILQAVLVGCVRLLRPLPSAPLVETAQSVERIVGELVDPLWRRAMRADARLDEQESPTFSKFAAASVHLLARQTDPDLAQVASSIAATLASRFAPYNAPGVAPSADEVTHLGNVALVEEVDEIFQEVLPPDDLLRGWKHWMLAQMEPSWLRLPLASGLSSLDGLFDVVSKQLPRKPPAGPVTQTVLSEPLEGEPLQYLRRHRPDLDLTPLPDPDGYRLRGAWHTLRELVRWAAEELSGGIRAVIRGRAARAEPREATVAADGSGDFRTIGEAVESLGEDATIHVAPGEYFESVQLRPGQKLLGSEEGLVAVDARGEDWVLAAADRCEIRGLTVLRGGQGGVLVRGCREVAVTGNRIVQNGQYGLLLGQCVAAVEHNLIAGNDQDGIRVEQGVDFECRFNRIANHLHSGVDVTAHATGVVSNNTVYDCNSGIIVGNEPGVEPMQLQIDENIFVGNQFAVEAPEGVPQAVEHNLFFQNDENHWDWNAGRPLPLAKSNVVADPKFRDAEKGDFRISADSPARGAGRNGGDIGALPYQADDEELPERSEIGVYVWHESVPAELPKRVEKRLQRLEYAWVKPEKWIYAKEKGDPALRSFGGGNTIHHHHDARAAAERMREELQEVLPLQLVGHDDSEEMFAGSVWGFEPGQMYVFISSQPAVWLTGLIAVTDYHGTLPEPAGSEEMAKELRRPMWNPAASGPVSVDRFRTELQPWVGHSLENARSEFGPPLGVILAIAAYVYADPEGPVFLLTSDHPKTEPYTAIRIDPLAASLRRAFDHVVLVVSGYQATAELEASIRSSHSAPLLEFVTEDRHGDSLVLVSRLGHTGPLIEAVRKAALAGIDVHELASRIEKRFEGRVEVRTSGDNFEIHL